MLEIYNETLNDLLAKSGGAALDIRVLGKSVSVPGLTRVEVRTEADILTVMEMGEKNWKIASIKMNIQRCRRFASERLECLNGKTSAFSYIVLSAVNLLFEAHALTWWWRWRWKAQMRCPG